MTRGEVILGSVLGGCVVSWLVGFVLVTTPPVTSAGRRPPGAGRPDPTRALVDAPAPNQGPRAGAGRPRHRGPGLQDRHRRTGAMGRAYTRECGSMSCGYEYRRPLGQVSATVYLSYLQQETPVLRPGLNGSASRSVGPRPAVARGRPAGLAGRAAPGAPERVRDDVEV